MVNPQLAKLKSKDHQRKTSGTAIAGTPVEAKKKKEEASQVGGIILALLLFVVVGSAVIQVINNARNALMYGEQAQME
ncbi:Serp1 [Acrasis kona]|uniref:Serp1 n=1 Tax=Acrasis kona TaxID=1008807 RepID=A0AAW2YTM7_9EUKA